MMTIVITGVTSGIGKSLMGFFLDKGERVIGIGRSKERLIKLERAYKEQGYKHYDLVKADFARLTDIDEAVVYIKKRYKHGIDVLINNAAIVPQKKHITEDGHEMQFQVNHLAVVKLTHGLLPLIQMVSGMVITTSSNAHRPAKFVLNDLEATRRYGLLRSYARTKLYNILFTRAMNTYVYPKTGVYNYAVHPGLVKTEIGTKDTSRLYAWFWRMFTKRGISPDDAVSTYQYLVYDHERDEACYFYQCVPEKMSKQAASDVNRDALWQATNQLLGIDF